MKLCLSGWAAKVFFVLLLLLPADSLHSPVYGSAPAVQQHIDLDALEKEINAYVADPSYADDPYILAAIREAIMASKDHNGGIGACLVCEATGEIVERGHNSQFTPYFNSSLHAEMVLLDRYEERMRETREANPDGKGFLDPRKKKAGLILYTSVEPCPMCMSRIINSGVKKVYYATADETGGMASRMSNLPPFWQRLAQGMVIEPARCSLHLKIIAQRLFHPMQGIKAEQQQAACAD